MKLIKSIIILGLLVTLTATAQEDVLHPHGKKGAYMETESRRYAPFSLGIELGANYNMFSQDHSWTPNYTNTVWDAVKTADGFSPYVSAFVDVPLNEKWGLQGKVTFDWKHFENSSNGIYSNIEYFGDITHYDAKYTTKADMLNIDLSLLLRYNFTREFFISAGPIVLFSAGDLTNTWSQTVYYAPNEYQSTGNLEEKYSPKTRIGLEAGLGYKFSLSKNLWLVPQVHFQWVPTLLLEDAKNIPWGPYIHNYENRKLNSLQLGLGLWFDFNK